MIINGFGGDGRIQGERTLIETITGTMQFGWYDISTWCYMNNAGYIGSKNSSSADPGATTSTLTIPNPSKYYGLGYRGVVYVPRVVTTTLTNGTFIVLCKKDSNQVPVAGKTYACAVILEITILNAVSYLVGRGTVVFNSNEIGSGNYMYGHVISASSLSWTLYQSCDSTTSFATMASTVNTRLPDPLYLLGPNAAGTVYWLNPAGGSSTSGYPNATMNKVTLYGGCPEKNNPTYYSTISSSNGGLCLGSSYQVYNSAGTKVTLTATQPSPLNVALDIYGIN